jgi:two-component system, chemotaxis family, sensor kinase CheA
MQCDDALLSDFLDESSQLMERLNEDMSRLDECVRAANQADHLAIDLDLLNNMFRSAHSIKGLSGMLGFHQINTLVHRVENVFDSARGQKLRINSEVVDVVFRSLDCLAQLLDQVRAGDSNEIDSESTKRMIDQLLNKSQCLKVQTTQADAELAVATMQSNFNAAVAITEDAISECEPVESPAMLATERTMNWQATFASITDETEIPTRYLAIFIDETELSLDRLTELLVQGETTASSERIDELLITSHRIKGSAASLGLQRVAKLAHFMEDMLQERREQGAPLTSQIVDALLKGADALRAFVISLKAGHPETGTFAAVAEALQIARLQAKEQMPSFPEWATAVLAECPNRTQSAFVGRIAFDTQIPLIGMKASLVVEKLAASGHLLYAHPAESALESLDEIPSLTFVLESVERMSLLEAKLRIAGVTSIEMVVAAAQTEQSQPVPAGKISQANAEVKIVTPAIQQPAVIADSSPHEEAKPLTDGVTAKSSTREAEAKPAETLRVDVERLDQLMNLTGQLVINKARLNRIGEGIKHAVPTKKAVQGMEQILLRATRIAHELERGRTTQPAGFFDISSGFSQLVLDLQQMQTELKQSSGLRGHLQELFDSLSQLDRVTDGIQKSVMDTRMVPIGPLFQRFKRVVRDITRSNGKEIQLVINGENTELDKRMIDELSDPLVHMVRNSADHGVESAEVREQQGKPRHGTITLNAFQRGSRVIIEVCDDGKGLDKDRILAKALEKGIITPADAERLTPSQIFALIWEPGFSTAEKVTEISGRGMGMDIVRSKIEGIKGVIHIDSVPGQGCKFQIVLPLTMAILPSLMIGIEGGVFALPLESVREIVSVRKNDIRSVHGVPTVRVRDRVISVVELAQLFTWSHAAANVEAETTENALVILEHEGKEIGLIAHQLLGEEDVVIESMDAIYGEIDGVAGASILGDGRVSLILDVGAMMRMACSTTASA